MARRLDVDLARQNGVVVDEDALPRHLDLVAQQHAVAFVVAIGQRRIEFRRAVGLHRLARPQPQTWRVARDGAGDRFLLLLRRQRDDIADPDVVCEHRAGGEHLHAGDDDAVILLAHHAQGRHRQILLEIEIRIARGLRRQHRISNVKIVVAGMLVIAQHVVGVRVGRGQRAEIHRHAGDEGGDVVRRAAEQAIGEIGNTPVADHAPLQILARARPQEIDRMAAAVLLVGHLGAKRRIGLHVVERHHRLRRVAERRVRGDVVDLFVADIDHAAVAQRFEMLFAAAQHGRCLRVRSSQSSAQRTRLSISRQGHCHERAATLQSFTPEQQAIMRFPIGE